ncbi:hypothetical protein ABHP49_005783 [Bacillus cereus]|uniref:hypothetical protein n=1 Tax=Bacillus TaxID=1386 RepID=UPI000278FCEB|nr:MULTISPECIES: hypothetical protein [Bacillus cereus group]MCU7392874.1 hypothetical protein [Bacillus sp. ST24]EJQ02177.1 hypothetical protein IE1_05366 [Bacillus cereus BAG3O-2]EJQ19261.1 hypothetical protein IE7_05376 [Bacillus cereus BAG4O-1]EKS8360930.1 hypothetical protein [Bacillus cereus]EKS8361517.1 hypothetical protein [Bacillus cereus]
MNNYLKVQESAKRINELSKHQKILEREKNILKSELYRLLKENKRYKENVQGIRALDI